MKTRPTALALRPGEQLVVAALRDSAGASRRELAERTGLPRTTVTATVATLIARGLVTEDDEPGGVGRGIGRPAATVRFAVADRTVAVIELGRTHQSATLMGLDGRLLRTTDLHLDLTEPLDTAAGGLAAAVSELAEDLQRPSAVVVSVAMPFRPGAGAAPIPMHKVTEAPDRRRRFHRPDWLLSDPTEALTDALGVPVMVENDANLAALGEAGHGAARGAHTAVCVSVVAGFGAGIVIGGRLFRGAGGVAGELAHVSIREDGDICTCGNRGCVVTVQRNGPSMVDDVATALGRVPTFDEIISLAGDGDVTVCRWLTGLGRTLARPLAGFVTLLNPDVLVVDGALGPAARPVVNGIRDTIERRTPLMSHDGLRIRPGQLATAAIPAGAAVLAHQAYVDGLLSGTADSRGPAL